MCQTFERAIPTQNSFYSVKLEKKIDTIALIGGVVTVFAILTDVLLVSSYPIPGGKIVSRNDTQAPLVQKQKVYQRTKNAVRPLPSAR